MTPSRRPRVSVTRRAVIDEDIVVEKVVPGGRSFARLADGRVALIDGAFPGDRVRLPLARDRGGHVEGTAEILERVAERRESPCAVAKVCGGCDWMELAPATQREQKLALVHEALRRTARLEMPPGSIELIGRGSDLGYRRRIRLQIKGGRIGFFSAGSHELVEVETCVVSAEPIRRALTRLRAHARTHAALLDVFAHVEVRSSPSAERCSLYFATRPKARVSEAARRALTELADEFSVRVQGEPEVELERFELDGVYVLAAPGAFTQVNWDVNRALVEAVVQGAKQRGLESFLDLYCGSGNFSLPLLASGLSGKGVEVTRSSIACAERAQSEQRLSGGTFIAGDVSDWARRFAEAGERYDLVVLDPPRAGAKEALSAVQRLASRSVVLVACDPVTFARDVRTLLDCGLVLEGVTAFDMFPQTHHVECLAWLRAGG